MARKYPTAMQSFQAGSLMAVGDMTSQVFIEKNHKLQQLDWKRPVRFFIIGCCVVGPALKMWYGVLDRHFGAQGRRGTIKKVLLDQGLFAPTFIVVFLTSVGLLQFKTLQQIQDQIKRDYIDIVLAGYMVWPAVQALNFSLVPLQHQVLVVQTFALFWNTYLAWKTNREAGDTSSDR
ncbi:Mpv17/PMP22 [Trinorchestia longiramus]|nr:Mpv17/PMP22 [Trinorchestia longiramus]